MHHATHTAQTCPPAFVNKSWFLKVLCLFARCNPTVPKPQAQFLKAHGLEVPLSPVDAEPVIPQFLCAQLEIWGKGVAASARAVPQMSTPELASVPRSPICLVRICTLSGRPIIFDGPLLLEIQVWVFTKHASLVSLVRQFNLNSVKRVPSPTPSV